ncbi:DUF550 domain-containing protein [Nannocystis sp. ILAH1]|uniref:dATP/dGTP pyrophosphohydrolase domain-containing protein n=1 Tax=Nannocystis sp. ILAH1 TaxID=2996789 RepID=UPI0022705ACE|nr:dATP/dGTP pyrophosphohydrolase domain-containing protein [Nannocystis sp. ILAH1]MCY0985996.1 DUF550 domain-containing protein [Nannocystis sp. ILAH1]
MTNCTVHFTIDASLLHRQGLTGLYQAAMPKGYTLGFREEGSWYFWERAGQPGGGSAHKDPSSVVRHAWEHADAAKCSGGFFDFEAHLARQRAFSESTFGPGPRAAGVVDHILKELEEIEENPSDLAEWIDVVILGLDGAWRTGATPRQIIEALVAKQTKNEGRTWPDWRKMPSDKAIEHTHDKGSPPRDTDTARLTGKACGHMTNCSTCESCFRASLMPEVPRGR